MGYTGCVKGGTMCAKQGDPWMWGWYTICVKTTRYVRRVHAMCEDLCTRCAEGIFHNQYVNHVELVYWFRSCVAFLPFMPTGSVRNRRSVFLVSLTSSLVAQRWSSVHSSPFLHVPSTWWDLQVVLLRFGSSWSTTPKPQYRQISPILGLSACSQAGWMSFFISAEYRSMRRFRGGAVGFVPPPGPPWSVVPPPLLVLSRRTFLGIRSSRDLGVSLSSCGISLCARLEQFLPRIMSSMALNSQRRSCSSVIWALANFLL